MDWQKRMSLKIGDKVKIIAPVTYCPNFGSGCCGDYIDKIGTITNTNEESSIPIKRERGATYAVEISDGSNCIFPIECLEPI